MCANELTGTITEIMNSAFMSNTFQYDVKKQWYSPFKKKDDMNKSNYKPVIFLSVFSVLWNSSNGSLTT